MPMFNKFHSSYLIYGEIGTKLNEAAMLLADKIISAKQYHSVNESSINNSLNKALRDEDLENVGLENLGLEDEHLEDDNLENKSLEHADLKYETKVILSQAKKKLIDREFRPDIMHIKPKNGNISIEEIRKIKPFLYSSAAEEGAKIVLVEEFDQASLQAMNAILKALEEPGHNSHFILTSYHLGSLPATIRSRCLKIRLAKNNSIDIETDPYFTKALDIYKQILHIMLEAPKVNIEKIHQLSLSVEKDYEIWVPLQQLLLRLLLLTSKNFYQIPSLYLSEEKQVIDYLLVRFSLEEIFALEEYYNDLCSKAKNCYLDHRQVIILLFKRILA